MIQNKNNKKAVNQKQNKKKACFCAASYSKVVFTNKQTKRNRKTLKNKQIYKKLCFCKVLSSWLTLNH